MNNIRKKCFNRLPDGHDPVIKENECLLQDLNNSSETVVVDAVKSHHNDPYIQKLPISFISPKDWQKYLHFSNLVNSKNKEGTFISHIGKNGRILRLLNSFHNLYIEYSHMCTKYTPCLQSAGDIIKNSPLYCAISPKHPNQYTIKSGDNPDSFFSEKKTFIDAEAQTLLSMKNIDIPLLFKTHGFSENDLETSNSISNSILPYGFKKIIQPAKQLAKRLKHAANCGVKIKDSLEGFISFDKIMIFEKDINIEIFEEINRRLATIHKFSINILDRKQFNIPKIKFIQIPLAIELLSPKIQKIIENILYDCPFLCDPLEVAAELRQCGYDQKICTEYFKATKCLRYIIEEIAPSNNIPNSDIQSRSMRSSVLSTNSRAASCETITFFNSNAIKDKESIFSTDPIPFTINDSENFPLTNKRLSKHNSINMFPTLTADCLTQTSRVHFYMDDKNMESFFYQIKEYIFIMRQLHAETREEIEYLQKQLGCVFTSLKSHIALLINQNSNQVIFDDQKNKMLTLSHQVEELKMKLKKEERNRRNVYNIMHEQMGNIRVYCRSRNIQDGGNVLEFIGNEIITSPFVSNEIFEFDKVFQPSMSQEDVYEEFMPLVMSFIDGYNVCFITYGGEASGKTFTLIGGNEGSNQQGLMQRALTTILTEDKLRHRDWEYKITAGVVEIYNDNCIDVLSGEFNIQLYVENGMEIAYQKLKSVPITNEADIEALMQVCRLKRKVAKTALNPSSSRSHLITLIRLQGRSRIHGENICSFLCLCDLAGFEDIIKAETQMNKILSKEAGYINRSLTAFNRVFVSLRKQDPNTVSYRDTKLTHLLKPFLTNSGKCALIVTVRNDKRSIGSTQNTLRFGRETRGVTLGKAKRQVNLNNNVSVL